MIFYFTGTGNSLQVAKTITTGLKEELVSIADKINSGDGVFSFQLKENETIGFVFPVYAWGPPGMVMEFIDKLKLNNYKNNYTFSVATCGANIGNTMRLLEKQLITKSLKLDSGFSISMPNNYIVMGDVDSKEACDRKLKDAEETILEILKIIEARKKGVFKIVKGPLPGILTAVINPLFNKHGINTKKFFADDRCNGCGICERVCNTKNIKVDKKPQWGDKCSQCLACINYCPTKALQYGKGSAKKGRYKNPNVNIL